MFRVFLKYNQNLALPCLENGTNLFVQHSRISTSTHMYGKSQLANKQSKKRWLKREQKMVERLKTGTSANDANKKKKWHGSLPSMSASLISNHSRPSGPSAGTARRAKQLNVIMYDRITGLLNTGEVMPQLLELGFQVSEVKLSLDFGTMTVFWLATGGDTDNEVEQLLPECAAQLRQALISLRVMGNVPKIQFSKDMSVAKMEEIERLLRQADMGPDHEPTPLGASMQRSPSLGSQNKQHSNISDYQGMESVPGGLGAGLPDMPKTREYGESFQQKFDQVTKSMERKDMMSYTGVDTETGAIEIGVKVRDNTGGKQEFERDNTGGKQEFENGVKNDVYGVDHDSLMAKIAKAKRKPAHRLSPYESFERSLVEGMNRESILDNLDVKDIKKELNKGYRNVEKKKDKQSKLTSAGFEAYENVRGYNELNVEEIDEEE